MTEFELLKKLLERARNLQLYNEAELDDIRRKGRMALENLFPTKSYCIDIKNIAFKQFRYSPTTSELINDWKDGQTKLINLLDTAISDYDIQLVKKTTLPTQTQTKAIIQEKIVPVIDESAVREVKQQFIEYRQAVRKWLSFALVLILSTIGLWLFYYFSNWNWFNNHPKKLGITLMLNLTIILLLLNIPIKKRWAIWIPTAIAVVATLFTII